MNALQYEICTLHPTRALTNVNLKFGLRFNKSEAKEGYKFISLRKKEKIKTILLGIKEDAELDFEVRESFIKNCYHLDHEDLTNWIIINEVIVEWQTGIAPWPSGKPPKLPFQIFIDIFKSNDLNKGFELVVTQNKELLTKYQAKLLAR